MFRLLLLFAALVVLFASPAAAAINAPSALTGTWTPALLTLSWNDNSNNESGFLIERKQGANGVFKALDTVDSDIVFYQDEDLDPAVIVADADDAVLADEVHEEVAGVGDLRLVAHEVPGAREDPFQLELVDRLVKVDAPVDRGGDGIDHSQELIDSLFAKNGFVPAFARVLDTYDNCDVRVTVYQR